MTANTMSTQQSTKGSDRGVDKRLVLKRLTGVDRLMVVNRKEPVEPVNRNAPVENQQKPAENLFSFTMMLSGARCMFSYVVFPWVLPAVGIASGMGNWLGVSISLVAISFNVLSIKRFWGSNHRYKWLATSLNIGTIALLATLMVVDISSLLPLTQT